MLKPMQINREQRLKTEYTR